MFNRRPFLSKVYLLYAVTIFLSSFLLFQVQPLVGKHMLPWFGGSSAVWITAMLFFMVALAVGYVYALVLTYFSKIFQIIIHTILTLVILVSLYLNSQVWSSAITPGLDFLGVSSADPAMQILLILSASIGLPFFLLSATSSLLQYWYGVSTTREPFSLYAISNTGSLLGLISYPIFFERFLSTSAQGAWWSMGFVAYCCLLFGVITHYVWVRKKAVLVESQLKATGHDYSPTTKKRVMWWVIVASIPVATMLTGTSFITGYIASIPFLWIIPLALYLISFIISFRPGFRLSKVYSHTFLFVVTALALMSVVSSFSLPVWFNLSTVFLAMFCIFHFCHDYLYENRPVVHKLPIFYVALSLGGILASVTVLVSLHLLTFPHELIYILWVLCVYSGIKIFREAHKCSLKAFPHFRWYIIMLLVLVNIAVIFKVYNDLGKVAIADRNFFGFKEIQMRDAGEFGIKTNLIHGTTNHGYQFDDPAMRSIPTSYYGKTSGIASAFSYVRQRRLAEPLRVAVAGLGTGALSAYCVEGDVFRFFEIDPQVVALSNKYFSYVSLCAGAEILIGDARLLLEKETQGENLQGYDMIILDAYSDDLVPIHLMTTEAIATYKKLLSPDGIIALHISSRYLDLLPVVSALAEDNDLFVGHLFDRESPAYANSSLWAILSPQDVFEKEEFSRFEKYTGTNILWTDTYSSLWPVIKWVK